MTPEDFLEALEVEYELLFPHTTWMPGVLKLLHHFYKVGFKYGNYIGAEFAKIMFCNPHL